MRLPDFNYVRVEFSYTSTKVSNDIAEGEEPAQEAVGDLIRRHSFFKNTCVFK